MSFRRIVNTPRRRFGRAKMGYLEELRERLAGGQDHAPGPSPLTLFETLAGHLGEKEFQNSDMAAFVQFVRQLQESHCTKRISEIVNQVAVESGYESYIRELGDEERLDNLTEFKRIANEFEREFGEDLSLQEFLRQIALQSGEDGDEDKDAVKLMTIHSSKGLEFPVVFILGFTEGIFPSSKTLGERRKLGLEEERRLCYVAITRAQKHLFLMESEGTSQNGMQKLVSRFLEEIGEENYVRIGRISEELWKESRGYAAKLNRELQQEPVSASRQVGDEVEHHVFGRGKIEAIDEKRGSYSIRFEKLPLPRNISANYFLKKHEKIDRETYSTGEQTGKAPHAAEPEILREKKALEREFPGAERPAEAIKQSLLQKQKENTPNLWKRDDVPHSGWSCVDVVDLGEPIGICQMCGSQIIRYAHQMEHPDYRNLSVGCICAGKMEGDIANARRRESEFKKKQTRRKNFFQKDWKRSQKGNEYLKAYGHVIVLYHNAKAGNMWKYSIDNAFCPIAYPAREQAVAGAFEALERLR